MTAGAVAQSTQDDPQLSDLCAPPAGLMRRNRSGNVSSCSSRIYLQVYDRTGKCSFFQFRFCLSPVLLGISVDGAALEVQFVCSKPNLFNSGYLQRTEQSRAMFDVPYLRPIGRYYEHELL
jgi:hypothetical protein